MGNDRNNDTQPRRRAVRTALVLGGVVFMIYLGFILRGVIGAS